MAQVLDLNLTVCPIITLLNATRLELTYAMEESVRLFKFTEYNSLFEWVTTGKIKYELLDESLSPLSVPGIKLTSDNDISIDLHKKFQARFYIKPVFSEFTDAC